MRKIKDRPVSLIEYVEKMLMMRMESGQIDFNPPSSGARLFSPAATIPVSALR